MKLVFSTRGWEDYLFWQASDPVALAKINGFIVECRRDPFRGTGKPEPLKGNWSGWWSRRIGGERRLVYRVTGSDDDQRLEIAQCRFHY